jgi:hypothetical protein
LRSRSCSTFRPRLGARGACQDACAVGARVSRRRTRRSRRDVGARSADAGVEVEDRAGALGEPRIAREDPSGATRA